MLFLYGKYRKGIEDLITTGGYTSKKMDNQKIKSSELKRKKSPM